VNCKPMSNLVTSDPPVLISLIQIHKQLLISNYICKILFRNKIDDSAST
jgi:hypothetical protein